MCEVKNKLGRINGKLDIAQENINKLECRTIETKIKNTEERELNKY